MLTGRLLGAFPGKAVGSPALTERSVPFDSAVGFKQYHECVVWLQDVWCRLGMRFSNPLYARLVTPARMSPVS